MSTASLRREISRLRKRGRSRRREIPVDRVEFARLVGLDPDPWQLRLLRSDASRILLNCSRQSGKSTMATVIALHRALLVPASLVLILAPAERQAKELFSKVAEMYRTLGHLIPADSYRKLGVELTNRSRIEALPGTEKTVRGFSGVNLLIVEEGARVADELYFAVRPMLAVSGGKLLMLSTPFGKRGSSTRNGPKGPAGSATQSPLRSACGSRPRFSQKSGRPSGSGGTRKEYECRFMEAVDSVFTSELIQAALSDEVEPLFGESA